MCERARVEIDRQRAEAIAKERTRHDKKELTIK
jgi:hypothetical protein